MRHLFFLFGILLIVVSCQDLQPIPAPDNLIPRSKMEDIIYDISVVNAARGFNVQKLKRFKISPDSYVFEKYGIDSIQFAESTKYYAQDLEEYRKMYMRIEKRLSFSQKMYDSIHKVEKKEKDSLRKIRSKELKKNDSIRKSRRDSISPRVIEQVPNFSVQQ